MIRKPTENESLDCIKLLYMSGPNMFSYFMIGHPPEIYEYIRIFYTKPDVQFSQENVLVKIDNGKVTGILLAIPVKEMRQMDKNMGKYGKEMVKTMGVHNVLKMMGRVGMQKHLAGAYQDDKFYVSNLAVSEEYRGKGYAVELLKKAEELAREKQYTKLSLLVELDNPHAKRIYEKFGFVETARFELPEKYHKFSIEGVYKMVKILEQTV